MRVQLPEESTPMTHIKDGIIVVMFLASIAGVYVKLNEQVVRLEQKVLALEDRTKELRDITSKLDEKVSKNNYPVR